MIILDTNVVSEFMASQPMPEVLEWLNQQRISQVYLSTVTLAEINYGLKAMPSGKRQALLTERFDNFITKGFTGRLLPFDAACAKHYGDIMSQRNALGKPMSAFDGQIAAIAKSKDFTLATRNIKDFLSCGITLVNPFDTST